MLSVEKKYALVNKKSGKIFRKATTRDQARMLKRDAGFKHAILNTHNMEVVR